MTPSTCRCCEVDPYGNFIPGANGFAQLIVGLGPDGIARDRRRRDWWKATRRLRSARLRSARCAPARCSWPTSRMPPTRSAARPARRSRRTPTMASATVGNPATYDDELLAEHFMAGDGRVNENIGLTAVHHVFHAEHNRLVEHTKDVVLATGDLRASLTSGSAGRRRRAPCRRRQRRSPLCNGTASGCSRRRSSAPRCSTSTSCSRSSRARSSPRSMSSLPRPGSIPRSIRRSSPSSRTSSIASAIRCCWTRSTGSRSRLRRRARSA